MTLKLHNNGASARTGRNAGRPFFGLLLMTFGLLLGFSQRGMAAPEDPARLGKSAHHGASAAKATRREFDCNNFTWNINPNNSVADGTTNDVVTIVVTDQATGLPVVGLKIQIQTAAGDFTPKTDATGTATLGLADIYATSIPFTIIVPNSCTPAVNTSFNFVPAPVNPNPGPGSANPSYYITTIGTANADGSDTAVVQLHATDGINNELAGTPIRFTIVGGTAENTALLNGTSVSPGTPYVVPGGLQSLGSYDLPISNSQPGTVQVEAEVWNGTTWVQIGTPQTVTFVVPPPNPNPPPGSPNPSYYITVIPQATANSSDTAVVQLHITDGIHNEPDGYPVEFVVTSLNTASTTAVMGGTATGTWHTTLGTNSNGSIDVPVTDANAGPVTIQAYAWDPATNAYDISFGTQTVTFVAAPPNPNPPPGSPNPSYYITVIPQAAANTPDTAVVKLHITDGTNNEPDGYPVEFVVTSLNPASTTAIMGGTATGTWQTTLATNSNGSIDVPVTDVNAGSVTIQAYAWDPATNAYDISFGTQTVTFVVAPPNPNPPPGSPNPSYYITVIPQATANGSDTTVVQLHITDGVNNEPDGYQVEFVVTSTNQASTAAIMTGTVGNKVTGTLTTVLGTNANGSIDVPITDLKTGPVTIQAYAWDPATNAYDISFGTQTVIFVAGQPVPGNPGGGGSGGGNPGGGGSNNGGSGPGGNNSGPGSNSGFTILFYTQNDRLSNGSQQDSVYAYVTDINKNPVPGVSVTFFIQTTPASGTITSGDQIVGSTTGTTDSSGLVGIGIVSTMPGTAFIDATIVDPTTGNTVLIDGSYQIVTFDTRPDTTNLLTALHVMVPEALADGVQQTEVRAQVVDLSGQFMPGQLVYFSIDSGSGTIVTPQPVMTNDSGNAYIYITSTTPGYVLITATVDSEHIIFGSPARVQFAPINIYVPRVFTPNGDGTNDILKPILVGITTFHYMSVYNRWGNLIWTTQDPNQGWDGTFKGVPQPVETYLWIAEGIDENGKKIVAKGMVSLVR